MNTSHCPDENLLAKFVEGNAGPALSSSVEQHLDRCAACTDLLAALAQAYRHEEPSLEPVERAEVPAPRVLASGVAAPCSASAPAWSQPQFYLLLSTLMTIHVATVALLAPLWLARFAALDAPVAVTPMGHWTLLLLCSSGVSLAVIFLASVGRWWQRSKRPLLTLAALSWSHPAALVLASITAVAARKTITPAQAHRLSTWLMGASMPVFLVVLVVIAGLQLLPNHPGLDVRFASFVMSISAAGLLSAVAALVTSRRQHRASKPLGLAFGVISLASGVATAIGLGVLLLLSSRQVEGDAEGLASLPARNPTEDLA